MIFDCILIICLIVCGLYALSQRIKKVDWQNIAESRSHSYDRMVEHYAALKKANHNLKNINSQLTSKLSACEKKQGVGFPTKKRR